MYFVHYMEHIFDFNCKYVLIAHTPNDCDKFHACMGIEYTRRFF